MKKVPFVGLGGIALSMMLAVFMVAGTGMAADHMLTMDGAILVDATVTTDVTCQECHELDTNVSWGAYTTSGVWTPADASCLNCHDDTLDNSGNTTARHEGEFQIKRISVYLATVDSCENCHESPTTGDSISRKLHLILDS